MGFHGLTFVSQLVEIAILTALERTPGGKSSEGIIQLTHPAVKVILFLLAGKESRKIPMLKAKCAM